MNPHPTKEDKEQLEAATGMTRQQINDWFVNKRQRCWKPFIESLCKELRVERGQDVELHSISRARVRAHLISSARHSPKRAHGPAPPPPSLSERGHAQKCSNR